MAAAAAGELLRRALRNAARGQFASPIRRLSGGNHPRSPLAGSDDFSQNLVRKGASLGSRFYSTEGNPSGAEVEKESEEDEDEYLFAKGPRRRKSEKYGKYDPVGLQEEIDTFPEAEDFTHLYNARQIVEDWMGHPTFWGMVSEDALQEESKAEGEPPGEGPILRWETRLILGPGGNAWHPANRKVKVSVYVKELGLTPLARERLIALVGRRYYPNKDELTIVSERFRDREENRKDVLRTLMLVIREAKKADALASGELHPDDLVQDYVADTMVDYQKEKIESFLKDPAFLAQLIEAEKEEEKRREELMENQASSEAEEEEEEEEEEFIDEEFETEPVATDEEGNEGAFSDESLEVGVAQTTSLESQSEATVLRSDESVSHGAHGEQAGTNEADGDDHSSPHPHNSSIQPEISAVEVNSHDAAGDVELGDDRISTTEDAIETDVRISLDDVEKNEDVSTQNEDNQDPKDENNRND